MQRPSAASDAALATGRGVSHGERSTVHSLAGSRTLGWNSLVVSLYGAYPADKGFRPIEAHPEAVNHRADAYVLTLALALDT